MALTKRMRRIQEKRYKDFEAEHPRQKFLPVVPWTNSEIAELDQMKLLLEKIKYQQDADIGTVVEFLRHSHLFGQTSQKIGPLQQQAQHYQRLVSSSAKRNLWQKAGGIYCLCGDLEIELSILRASRDRGGDKAQ